MKAILRKLLRPAPLLWEDFVACIDRKVTGADIATIGGTIETTVKDGAGEPLRWLDPTLFMAKAITQGCLFWFGTVPAVPADRFLCGLNSNDLGTEGVHFHQAVTGELRGRVRRANVYTADLVIGTPAVSSAVALCIGWDGLDVAVYMNGLKITNVAAAQPLTFNRLEFSGWQSTDLRFGGVLKTVALFDRKPTDFEAANLTKRPERFF